jgi:hypothetical protein
MMLGPAERLVKHSSTAGLAEGRMVSVSTGSKFEVRYPPKHGLSLATRKRCDLGRQHH